MLVARGMSNLEIAERLFVGESTVKTHVADVLSKLGARDRIHAVVFRVRVRSRAARPAVTIHEGAQTDRRIRAPPCTTQNDTRNSALAAPTPTVCVLARCPRTRVD
jgi:hypothetical protein